MKHRYSFLMLAACFALPAHADWMSKDVMITVTNNMDKEFIAPVLVTDLENDEFIFDNMNYVTSEAETQILTGDPKMLVEAINDMDETVVAHGTDGEPAVLLAPGNSITFKAPYEKSLRIIAMVAPTMYADHFVSETISFDHKDEMAVLPFNLKRYDIGYDEGTKKISLVGESDVTVQITTEKM